ncbi:MAG: SusC/RagA family TonB-linked outer membrane protein [Gemmatimonadota bacterium]
MRSRGVLALLAAALGLALSAPAPLTAQETGTITGAVTDSETGQPLQGVQVFLPGTQLGFPTGENGRFLIQNVPAGTYRVQTQLIGYTSETQRDVVVPAGGTVEVNFELGQSVLSIDNVVVTGVSDPIEGVKIPFSVGRISEQDLKAVPATSALNSLQGKVAGVNMIQGTGQPGNEASIMLRTPTSIENEQAPMIIVDGVIMSSTMEYGGSTVDLESLDIQDVEIVKGAAAASLYGSRAAAGVINITTSRGQGLALDQTRISGRAEIGRSTSPKFEYNKHHRWVVNENGDFTDYDGNVVPREERVPDFDLFYDNPYKQIYDNLSGLYQPGAYMNGALNLSHNAASSNFLASVNRLDEEGSLAAPSGFVRNSGRLNLDHRLADDFSFAVSTNYSRSVQNDLSGTSFWNMYMWPVDINLNVRDPATGLFPQQPDSTYNSEHPFWNAQTRESEDRRTRTLISGDARYNPFSWLSMSGNASYDRSEIFDYRYTAKGIPQSIDNDDPNPSSGSLARDAQLTDNYNGYLSVNGIWQLGDLTLRNTARGLFEREKRDRFSASGSNLGIPGIEDLSVAMNQSVSSSLIEIRANGFSLNTGADYAGKYIGDFLVRRDGSSLFGPEERWQTYYRAAGAWRMSEEAWWPFEALSEFKPRAAIGTAGGRPGFSAQYETWSVSCNDESCSVAKNTLGNRRLAPEHTTEIEFGTDMVILDKYSVELTYAMQETTGQIIGLPTPAYTGYSTRYFNTGVFSGETLEATVQASLVNRPGLSWTTTVVGDKLWSRIDEWNRACYATGEAGQLNFCEGSSTSDFWGFRHLTSLNESMIVARHGSDVAGNFQINDDGYLVPVGAGNDYTDGVEKDLWGTKVAIGDHEYDWGLPIVELDDAGAPLKQKLGSFLPDFQLGWLNNVTWGGLNLHAQVHSQVGGKVYNYTKQRLYQHERDVDLDQSGKPTELKKPDPYYQNIYNRADATNHFAEDGTFVKLRSLSALYRLNSGQLDAIGIGRFASSIGLGIVGRNLLTLTGYSGFDPEVGNVTNRFDDFSWPNTRTFTGTVEITF